MDDYDVIIIGTGAGGGTLARHLAPSGKRILLLERGDWLPRELENWDPERSSSDNRYVSPDTWYDAKARRSSRGPLLRRRRDQIVRRGAVPASQGGLRRAPAPRRPLARLADRLRRARAVLHPGRAALPGARRARRGSDRAAGQRAVPAPGRLARATNPATRRRPRGGRLPPVPRALRDHARRVEPAVQPLHSLQHLRRLPVPRPCEVRRRGARRAAGARAPERHPADEREGHEARARTTQAPRSPRSSSSGTARRSGSPATSSSSRAARPTAPSCCSSRPATSTRTGSPTAPTRSVATTCSTTPPPCSRCHARKTRPSSRRRSALNDFYFGSDDFEYPLGNIQMVGKSQAPMFRGEQPERDQARARMDTRADGAPRDRLLALDRGSAAARTTASPSTATASSRSPTPRPTPKPRSGSTPRSSRRSGSST